MRTVARAVVCGILLVLTGLLLALAAYFPPFFDVYTGFSRDALAFLSGITGPFPFAVWEILLLLLVLLFVYTLIRAIRKKRLMICWLLGVAEVVCLLVFLFVGLFGVNYFAPPVSERIGLEVGQYTTEQLRDATQYMADQAGYWAGQVERDENGHLAIDFDAMAEKAPEGYTALAQTYDFFSGSTAPVKKLLTGKAFSYMGITGISIPFTGESCVNSYAYAANIPFTMCHEVAHRMTVAPEDEANFCAFLACKEIDDPAFQYSGWYSVFVYCYNSLKKVDAAAAKAVMKTVTPQLAEDMGSAYEHYEQYDGAIKDAAQKVNDTYLKVFDEESGVQSYGEVTDLLIAWYLAQKA